MRTKQTLSNSPYSYFFNNIYDSYDAIPIHWINFDIKKLIRFLSTGYKMGMSRIILNVGLHTYFY